MAEAYGVTIASTTNELTLNLSQLRISMAAYDADDKFIDDIGDVPIKPGTTNFVPV